MERQILLLPEVAKRSRVPLETLRWYRKRGEGGPPTFRLGRRVVAFEDDVERWIEEQRCREHPGVA